MLWSWVSKRDEGEMELGWLGKKKMGRAQRDVGQGLWEKRDGREIR